MQNEGAMPLDSTINDRAGSDLHVNTRHREEMKGGDVIDVSIHYIQELLHLIVSTLTDLIEYSLPFALLKFDQVIFLYWDKVQSKQKQF